MIIWDKETSYDNGHSDTWFGCLHETYTPIMMKGTSILLGSAIVTHRTRGYAEISFRLLSSSLVDRVDPMPRHTGS